MFDFGFSEMLVVAVVALIVVGPQRLPKAARTVGHLLGRMQRYVADVKADVSREMQLEELQKLQKEVKEQAQDLENSMRRQAEVVESEFRNTEKTIRSEIEDAAGTVTSSAETTSPASEATSPVPESASPAPETLPPTEPDLKPDAKAESRTDTDRSGF